MATEKPTLVIAALPNLWAQMKEIVATNTVPSMFSRLVDGYKLADFEEELSKTDKTDYVIGVMSDTGYDVIREFCTRRAAQGGNIKWVHSLFAGVDALKLDQLQGVLKAPLSNAQGVYATMLAEHVALSCLYFNKQVCRLQQNLNDKVWDKFVNYEMRGSTIGIVGYGNIGKACAQVCKAFGMNVLGIGRSIPKSETDDIGTRLYGGDNAMAEALPQCDFVVALLPNTPATKHMFTATQFKMMKKTAVFINIGRGLTVIDDDLYEAITSGTIYGAACDVFHPEPLPQTSKLWTLPKDKFLMSAHNADIGPTCYVDVAHQFVKMAEDYTQNGKLPEYLVDLKRGY